MMSQGQGKRGPLQSFEMRHPDGDRDVGWEIDFAPIGYTAVIWRVHSSWGLQTISKWSLFRKTVEKFVDENSREWWYIYE